jgi:hypothetical protein
VNYGEGWNLVDGICVLWLYCRGDWWVVLG